MTVYPPIPEIRRHIPMTINWPPPATPEPSFIVQIWQKISELALKILKFFEPPKRAFTISKRQIRLIQEEKAARRLKKSERLSRKISDRIESPAILAPSILPLSEHPEFLKFSAILQGFSQILVKECIVPLIVKPQLKTAQDKLKETLESVPLWNDIFQNVRKSADPIFDKLKGLDDPMITLVIQQLFHVCLVGDDSKKDKLEQLLKDKFIALRDEEEITEKQFHEASLWIEPVLNWMYRSNNWFLNSNHPTNLHHFIFDSFRFFDAFVTQFKKGNLDEYFTTFSTFIDHEFNETLEKAIEINSGNLSHFVISRLVFLIKQMPWTKNYDRLLEVIKDHLEAFLEGERKVDEQTNLINKSSTTAREKPSNAEEIDKQRKAKEFLKIVEEAEGNEKFLEQKFEQGFSSHSGCTGKIKELLKEDNPDIRSNWQKEIITELVEKLFQVFLPDQKISLPQEFLIDINGIIKILETLILPEQLAKIKTTALNLFETVLRTSDVKDKANFREYFFFFGKLVVVEVIQGKIKELLAQAFDNCLNKMTHKSEIDALLGDDLFPNIIWKSFQSFLRAEVLRNPMLVAPILHQRLNLKGNDFERKNTLLNQLYKHMQSSVSDFKMEEEGITKDNFPELASPLIQELEDHLNLLKEKNPETVEDLGKVKEVIEKYLEWPDADDNSSYGKIILHILKVGDYGGKLTNFLISQLEATLSGYTSQTFHHIRENYATTIKAFVDSESKRLLDPEIVKKLLFSPELNPEEIKLRDARIKNELPKRIKAIAALSHDSLLRIPYVGYGLKFFGPSTSELDTLISAIYNKILKRPLINKALVLKCTQVIQLSLSESNA